MEFTHYRKITIFEYAFQIFEYKADETELLIRFNHDFKGNMQKIHEHFPKRTFNSIEKNSKR